MKKKVNGLSKNSKEIKKGDIYFCFEGKEVSGYDFILDALNNGASKIVGQRDLDIKNYEKVDNVNESMIKYAKEIYKNPQDDLKIIGITGTDGKTSTAILIDQILNELESSAYLGTNGFQINCQEEEYTDFTTPFSDKFYKFLRQSVDKKCKYFVCEVSSHALDQNRLGDLKFDACIFTNLSKEHLDYHKNIEEYYKAKRKLFEKIKPDGKIIINIDDKYGKILSGQSQDKNIITISGKDKASDFYFENVDLSIKNTKFDLIYKNQKHAIESNLLANFNVYNLVQAIASIVALGYDIEQVLPIIKKLFVPGRLEVIPQKDKTIIIDFAHTSDAINKVMEFIHSFNIKGSVHVLTGSAGKRDKTKRESMGENASKYADFLYLTEDDPRDEKVQDINVQIKRGVKNKNCKVFEIEKREEAIKKMVQNSKTGDVLILFGKGTMKYMYYDGYKKEYSEKETVKKILKG